eukprot:scaffold7398_cov362-Prasinococcus_capsulatus_cf.AAC.1
MWQGGRGLAACVAPGSATHTYAAVALPLDVARVPRGAAHGALPRRNVVLAIQARRHVPFLRYLGHAPVCTLPFQEQSANVGAHAEEGLSSSRRKP